MTELEIIAIANLEVINADEYRKYEKGFFPILKKHNFNLQICFYFYTIHSFNYQNKI